MTIIVASARSRATMRTSRIGVQSQAITLPSAGILAFSANAAVPATPQAAPFIQFPAPWSPVSDDPGIKLIIHNFSAATPIEATLLNADGSVFWGPLELVSPGGGQTSLGLVGGVVPGLPTSALTLALRNVLTGDAGGFSVEVQAWAV